MQTPSVRSALWHGLGMLLTPRMLLACLLPLLIFSVASLLLFVFGFSAATEAWNALWQWLLPQQWWLESLGPTGSSLLLLFLWALSILSLLGISIALGLLLSAMMVTPIVMRFVSQRHFAHLAKRGEQANSVSLGNGVKVVLIFAFGWLLTLPLWLIPPFPLLLSLFWSSYLFANIAKVDVLVEHATASERQWVLKMHNGGFWKIGVLCALGSFVPGLGLILPVFSMIVSAYYGLSALEALRANPPQDRPDQLGAWGRGRPQSANMR